MDLLPDEIVAEILLLLDNSGAAERACMQMWRAAQLVARKLEAQKTKDVMSRLSRIYSWDTSAQIIAYSFQRSDFFRRQYIAAQNRKKIV